MSLRSDKRISIGFFDPVSEKTGGFAYRKQVRAALSKKYDVEVFTVTGQAGIIPSVRLRRMVEIARVKGPKDVWIRDFYPVIGMSIRRNPGKNIALFLHMYTEGEESDMPGRLFTNLFFRNIRKCDRVVTIAYFWKDYLTRLGISNVRVILNAMDPEEFTFQPDEIEAFKRKYSLTDAAVVYIGNCRKNKGVVEAYDALKDQGYHLVTSGEPDVQLPCPNFSLPYREYLMLLKASSVVVTLSKFREGWCRTAHEAMLCKTPVVGSGAGGMAELLEGGGQFICRDLSELPHMVETVMSRSETVGEEGYRFASALTLERFEKEWSELIEEVVRDDSRPR
jgi:glycosyltransferase involved in cell wall biosynthesis